LDFSDTSGADIAIITTVFAGTTTFHDKSDGGQAQFITQFGGTVDFSQTIGPNSDGVIHAESIAGAGTYHLGTNVVILGSNNLSTEVSGFIDGGGASLTKVGSGRLTLSGNDTFTGALTLAGGAVDLASAGAVAGGYFIVFFNPGVTLKIEGAALQGGNEFVRLITDFDRGDTIDLPSIPFAPGANARYNASLEKLTLTSGGTTVTFDTFDTIDPALTNFIPLSDHAGGTKLVLGITATARHERVDATHHPAGQPALSDGSNVILALGVNDIIKPPGDNNIEIGGARGDVLYGGGTGDIFVFESLAASPPSHPDEIIRFKHSQGDKIDLYDLFYATHGQPLVFIGNQTFANYHHKHHTIIGMVRYAGGEVQVNVDHHFKTEFAIEMHGAPGLHTDDFVL
jgi:autotransporter-associated beta strand protein